MESPPSIDSMWELATSRFYDLTGEKLGKRSNTSSTTPIDDLKRTIESRLKGGDQDEKDRDKKAKWAKTKDAGLTILTYIQLLGGVAAQAASTVFGPADMCFNALNILLTIPQSIRDYHDAVAAIFAEVTPTLSQFKIYSRIELFGRGLDADLRTHVHKVMIAFVDVCATAINVKFNPSRWDRFRKTTQRIVLGETDLEDQLAGFKELVRGQQNIQSALTLEAAVAGNQKLTSLLTTACETGQKVDSIERGVKSLVETDRTWRSEATRRERMARIRTWLGIPDNASDDSKPMYENMLRKAIPITKKAGYWFQDLSAYRNWADRYMDLVDPCLLLSGGSSSGKSFSVSGVITHLKAEQTTHQSVTGDRCLIAFCFFTATAGKNDEDKRPLETALKWIAIQLAEQDLAYATRLAEIASEAKKSAQNMSNEQLWRTLRIASPMRKTTHYVIFDGLEELPFEERTQLLDIFRTLPSSEIRPSGSPCPIRVLASGRAETFDKHFSGFSGWPKIQLEKHNIGVMRDYITHTLAEQYQLQFQAPVPPKLPKKAEEALIRPELFIINHVHTQTTLRDMQRTVSRIRDLIASGSGEDGATFHHVHETLNELGAMLSSSDSLDKMAFYNAQRRLDEARKRASFQATTKQLTFRGIQITLEEVRDLIAKGRTERDLDDLLIKSAVETWKPDIRKLEERLDARQIELLNEILIWVGYGKEFLFVNELECALALRSKETPLEGLQDFISSKLTGTLFVDIKGLVRIEPDMEDAVFKDRQAPRHNKGPSTISLQVTINNADATTVQRFLWDLTEFATFDKFTFTPDATRPVTTIKPKIGVNMIDSNLAMVNATIKFLQEPPDPKTAAVGSYLFRNFPDVLGTLRVATGLDEIGYDDRQHIGKAVYDLFDDVEILRTHWSICDGVKWFPTRRQIDTFIDWASDPAAKNRLSRKDREWLHEVDDNEDSVRKFITPIMLMIGRLWLRTRDGSAESAFDWISGYLGLANPEIDGLAEYTHASPVPSVSNRSSVKDEWMSTHEDERTSAHEDERTSAHEDERTSAHEDERTSAHEDERTSAHEDEKDAETEPAESVTGSEKSEESEKQESLNHTVPEVEEPESESESGAKDTSDINDDVEFSDPVQAVMEWCEANIFFSEDDRDSLWYERLGDTYKALELPEKAIECYRLSIEKPNPRWIAVEGLALTLWDLYRHDEACQTMESVLENPVFEEELSGDKIVDVYMTLAGRLKRIPRPDKALTYYEKAAELRPIDPRVQCAALESCLHFEKIEEATEIVSRTVHSFDWTDVWPAGEEKSVFGSMLGYIITADEDNDYSILFARIAHVAKSEGCLDVLMEQVERATTTARAQGSHFELCVLLTYKGVAKFQDRHVNFESLRLALSLWDEACVTARFYLLKGNFEYGYVCERASWLQGLYHFGEAMKVTSSPEIAKFHASRMEQLMEQRDEDESELSAAKCFVAGYYASRGDIPAARKALMTSMTTALNMLADGKSRNDPDGFSLLCQVLVHAGDTYNARIAYDLYGPIPIEDDFKPVAQMLLSRTSESSASAAEILEFFNAKYAGEDPLPTVDMLLKGEGLEGPVDLETRVMLSKLRFMVEQGRWYMCVGCHVINWDKENSMHVCMYCHDTAFCDGCHQKLLEGPQDLFICGREHAWLSLPKWDMGRWLNYFNGVAEVPDGGGETIAPSKWLDKLVEDWGLSGQTWDFDRPDFDRRDSEKLESEKSDAEKSDSGKSDSDKSNPGSPDAREPEGDES